MLQNRQKVGTVMLTLSAKEIN